jgi:hypothetical protein
MRRLSSMGGAIRVKGGAEYFLDKPIIMHGEDVTIFGDGNTVVINLTQPLYLKYQKAE